MTDTAITLKKHTLYLDGLNCSSCAGKIEDQLHKAKEIEKVSFSFATKKLQFYSDMSNDHLQAIIQKLVDKIEDGVIVANQSMDDANSEFDACPMDLVKPKTSRAMKIIKTNIPEIIGAIILFTLMITAIPNPYRIIGFALAYVLVGGDVASRAIKNLFKGKVFDENFLMTLATVGAFILGELNEAVLVMLFYKVGEGFQDYAVGKSRNSIQSLLKIKAEFANIVEGNATKRVSPESLKIDDIIIIKPGEKVPVDGMIITGSTYFDTSALTGESVPKRFLEDDLILSGYINTDASITVKVTKLFQDSAVARILEMVENASSKKAKTEQFITKFARVYTPIVVISALLLALIPPLLGFGTFSDWISRALIFLVISCPCALVLSVPLGFFGGLGRASREGILIKGGNYLEALNSIDTFVFDKTGTLTKGNFEVVNVIGERSLELAAKLEIHSNHPIGLSIMKAYGKDISLEDTTNVREIAGQGLQGTYNHQLLLVGNDKLMKQMGIGTPKYDHMGTVVYVALDNDYIGALFIADEIKEDAKGLSTALNNHGDSVMLTGDQKSIANHVAKTLKIDQVYSELLPQDKLAKVEHLISQQRKVLFVGDGINDAPVLARADIGVAMGGLGSDAAIEAADIVLMTDEPSKLLDAIAISKKTRKIVMQNIIFALGIKLFFLGMGALGMATMYEAIFADVGVALIAVFNSMRILK